MDEPAVSPLNQAGTASIRIHGSARVEFATRLRAELLALGTGATLLLDWEQAEHVDASVLQVLLAFCRSSGVRGGAVTVTKDNPQIREYLQLAGLAEQFPLAKAESANSQ